KGIFTTLSMAKKGVLKKRSAWIHFCIDKWLHRVYFLRVELIYKTWTTRTVSPKTSCPRHGWTLL
ncbi:MAG TPA: hypothetical protein DCE42_18405, partial [Myxococcales bacterium]|nr:hypothetical protein [Myxococcales bacterium]